MPTAFYTLSLHDALPISVYESLPGWTEDITNVKSLHELPDNARHYLERIAQLTEIPLSIFSVGDRKSTRLNSSHVAISYAVFCLKNKTGTVGRGHLGRVE